MSGERARLNALYWFARLPSILLQIGWEPKWHWARWRS